MKYNFLIFIISLLVTANVAAVEKFIPEAKVVAIHDSYANGQAHIMFDKLDDDKLIKALGWVKDCGEHNVCGGHYFEPNNIIDVPNPQSLFDAPMDITAVKPAFFAKHGLSVVQGDVVLVQPGREIFSDTVTFFRDDKTGKLSMGMFYGNVKFMEHGKLVVADSGSLDFVNKLYSLNNGIYRLSTDTPTGHANVWGRAKSVIRDVAGVLKFKRATYSTCPPAANVWHLWGSSLTLDRNTGRGEVFNALIYIKKIPVFYVPYFNFPIDSQRKSGFLTPTVGYSSDSGYGISAPYYFNLAPNYDLILNSQLFTKRGILFDGLFRYLTPSSVGSIDMSYIPHDRVFADFRDTAISVNNSSDEVFRELKNSSSGRGFISLQNASHFDRSWYGSLNVNYATDDYFLQDFNGVNRGGDKDQLLNRADIGYLGDNWNFLGRLQVFKTLHQITQQTTQDQYMRLPQLNLVGDFPNGLGGLDHRWDAEIVNFMYRDELSRHAENLGVGGVRFNVMPTVSTTLNLFDISLVPKVQLQTTGYNLQNQAKIGGDSSMVRFHPLVSIDGGAVFRREINFFHSDYVQTLEPRLFYLFVPERDQDNIPLFDTCLPSFDFSQLFRTNRFSGIDRVGDAHQVALSVAARVLDDDGQEKFNAGIGQIVAIRKHHVSIKDSGNLDPLLHENFSPLVGRFQAFINNKLNATFDMAWDQRYRRFNTSNVNLQYINDVDRVINVWYNYTLHGDQLLQGQPIDLSRIGSSVGWKVYNRWNIIGSLIYNTSYSRAQSYLYGIEYDSCCWAMRAVKSKDFIGIGVDNSSNYDSRIYVQIMLKGFGNLGNVGLGEIVADRVSGYRDKFTRRI